MSLDTRDSGNICYRSFPACKLNRSAEDTNADGVVTTTIVPDLDISPTTANKEPRLQVGGGVLTAASPRDYRPMSKFIPI